MRWATHIGRTPRELLASTTSPEITEMMAFERLEPFGALADEFRIGQVAAAVANWAGMQRKDDSAALTPADFMPSLRRATEAHAPRSSEGAADMDADTHAALMDAVLFGYVSQAVH